EYYTPEHVREKYGLTPEQIIDMKGLMGDSSDNIPGVPGVGEKTAIKLLKQFHTVEELLSSIDEVSGKKLKEKLEEFKEQALMSKELATITTEAPLEVSLDSLGYEGFDREAVVKIFKDLGFHSLLERIGEEAGEKEEEQLEEIDVMIKTDITDDLFASPASLVVEQLGDNYHEAPILGFSIVNEHGAFFIPEETAVQSDRFKEWAEDESKKKWVFDAKRAAVALRWRGIELKGAEFDVLLAAYIINPGHSYDDVASVAKEHQLHIVSADEAVYGKGAKQAVPDEKELADHLARKAKAISLLREKLLDELEENEQLELFEALEMPLAHILGEMESIGVQVDVDRLKKMGEELSAKLAEYEKKIHESAGETFNINSPKQLGVILFEKLGLPVVKKTKTGYSTSADVLEKLRDKHVIIEDILHYRQIGKLQSTYVEGLLKVIKKDSHKVHTRFNQALTQTGRLSSTDPNLQNIPIRLEEGRKIRQAFVPSQKGWLIFAADYSQIELRVLAHISKDKNLIEAFTNDMDVHTKTAMDVFHVSEEEVTPAMRRQAKAVNFGIVYGISDYGLSQNLGITRKEAAAFIERYFHSFQGVKEYMEETVQEAKQRGYVTTLLSRRRYIPELTSRNFNLRSFAERTAMNTPIQGSAADIIKKAMIDMADKLKEKNLQAKLLLQVHDELIFEAPEDEIKVLEKLVPEVMEHALELDVPLKVDCASGPSWYDAK
ncbi:DNA polymerase I, partial [Bacillus sp. C1(2022)]